MTVLEGKIIDICIDLRRNSPTFGKSFKILLSEKNNIETITNLSLTKEINSFGDLKNTIRNYTVKDSEILKKVAPSKKFPPGIYENKELTVALNLSNKISDKHFKNSFDKRYRILSSFTEQIIDLRPLLIKIIYTSHN